MSFGDNRDDVAGFHGFANIVRVIAAIYKKGGRLGQVVGHHQLEAQIIRSLARCDVRPHGQARAIDAEVDLGREVEGGPENGPVDRFPTGRSRTAETLSSSPWCLDRWRAVAQPPLAPAAL